MLVMSQPEAPAVESVDRALRLLQEEMEDGPVMPQVGGLVQYEMPSVCLQPPNAICPFSYAPAGQSQSHLGNVHDRHVREACFNEAID